MPAPDINSSSPVNNFFNPANTPNAILALTDQVKWGSNGVGTGATVYYSFPSANDSSLWSSAYVSNQQSELYHNFTPLTAAQQSAATAAFSAWSNVANINFIAVDNENANAVGDIRIASTSGGIMDASTYAYANFPALNNPEGGDIWFNTTQPAASANDYSVGANGYQTMMHEIGHALGLDHPFDGSAKLDTSLDHYQYTIMSYSDIANNEDDGSATYYPTSPMLLDIQAIQYLYGANTNYNTGDNTYSFNDSLAYQTIWDAGGTDTIQYTGNLASVINLNAGQFSAIGPSVKANQAIANTAQDNIAIAYNVTIEHAIGGSANDTIYGNAASNIINGNAGTDTFITNLNRGDINNVVQTGDGGLVLQHATQQDTLRNVENVTFADQTVSFADLLAVATERPTFSINTNGNNAVTTPDFYSGPVGFLQYQYLGNDSNEVVLGSDANDFINLLVGDDAANGGAGQDVIDGGLGSNFLTGGDSMDTFFLDGRGGGTTWSTITDFNGDTVNIWGWAEGTSKILLQQEDGADGFKGTTLHIDLDGNNSIDTSVTFTGLSNQDISNQQAAEVSGNGYLLIS